MQNSGKARISIKLIILIPVLLLGIVTISSNIVAISNLRNVNKNASNVTDVYMNQIVELEKIEKRTQAIHRLGLSHIIAVDLDTMLSLVEQIRSEEALLEEYLESYKVYVGTNEQSTYDQLVSAYEGMKYEISNLMAYSAKGDSEAAYSLANTTISDYSNTIQTQIDAFIDDVEEGSAKAKEELNEAYNAGIQASFITIAVSLFAIVLTFYSVFGKIIRSLSSMGNELAVIISGIEQGEGDLTKRMSIRSNDEITDIAQGINTFLDKLQSIMKLIIDNSQKMEVVVNEVQQSVRTSNDGATDLSAATEELAATMQEVGNSATVINRNTSSVRDEVESIADKSVDINEYSKQMKLNADKMEEDARNNMQETGSKMSEILEVLNKAIEDSKSVDQVNSLTDEILQISSQTNLLALNASIEAARAGDAGKGFAVVADEIRQLADSSRTTANRIQDINGIVTGAVKNLSGNANNLVEYMKSHIMPEFENFVDSGVQYRDNATFIENAMDEFVAKTDLLRKSMDEIATSLSAITAAIDDGAQGVNGAAESTQALVMDMEIISTRMDENQKIADALQKETNVFTKF